MKCEGELPPFVDYAIPESYVSGIYDYEFDPLFVLSPGYNEGYYLDLSIRGAWSITYKIDTLHLGTIKTLGNSVEGIRQMATLYGECLVSFQKIMLYLKVDDGRPATLTTGYAIQYLSLFLFCLSKRHLFRA